MAKKMRPIGPEDKLTLVDHLDELRSRLIACVLVLVAVFAVCLWQSQSILEFVNSPMEESQRAVEIATEDPLAQQAAQGQRTGEALRQTALALAALSASMSAVGDESAVDDETKAAIAAATVAVEEAVAELDAVADAAPVYEGRRPVTLGVAEPFMTTLLVAGYAALLLSLPFLLYQAYAFILPAFTASERRIALPLMLLVPILFVIGAIFTYFVVLPGAVGFLQSFNAGSFDVLLQARAYYKFAVMMMIGIGLLFQIPVAVLLVTRLGIISPAQLRKNRGYVIFGVTVLAAIGNGSPDPFTMILVAIPLIALFEISVAVASWIEKAKPIETFGGADPADVTDDEPPQQTSRRDEPGA